MDNFTNLKNVLIFQFRNIIWIVILRYIFIKQNNLKLEAILITHRHGDHIAGVKKLLEIYPGTRVYAYADNDLFKPDVYVDEGDFIDFGFTNCKVIPFVYLAIETFDFWL